MCWKRYKIDIPQNHQIVYSEGDHVMRIFVDMRDPIPVLCFQEIEKWQPPFDSEPLSTERREQIFQRVVKLLTKLRSNVEIVRD